MIYFKCWYCGFISELIPKEKALKLYKTSKEETHKIGFLLFRTCERCKKQKSINLHLWMKDSKLRYKVYDEDIYTETHDSFIYEKRGLFDKEGKTWEDC